MDITKEDILLIVVLILIIYYYRGNSSEQFANKREKAEAIYNWFGSNDPIYKNYKRDLNKSSNIVEYEDTLLLKQKNQLSIDNIEKVI